MLLVITAAAIAQFGPLGARAAARPAPIGVSVSVSAGALRLAIHNGSVRVHRGQLSITNNSGTELGRVPLAYRLEYRQFPIDARVDGRTVTLAPSRNSARSTSLNPLEVEPLRMLAGHEAAGSTAKRERDDEALRHFYDQVRTGMTVSSLIGMGIGAVLGGVIGCVIGLTAVVVGCLVGVAPAAALGSAVGTIIGGGGNAIVAAIQYFQTINSPVD